MRIVHLGLGAFHRAHQALYLERLRIAGDRGWGLVSGNIRPGMEAIEQALVAQGGRYVLEEVAPSGERHYQRMAAIDTVLPYRPGLAELIELGADRETAILSFTVTEGGYYLDANDVLDTGHPEIVADLAAAREGRAGQTLYGALTAILRARLERGTVPLTLLSCDNLRANGERSRSGLLQFLERLGDWTLREWVRCQTTSPNSMVDRITPRPSQLLRGRVRAATGIDDAAPVMCEAFVQWVIEDRFCAGRPAWETAGAELVHSVAPYEEAKIRVLNASHSAIAWAGTLRGYSNIDEGASDAAVVAIARRYVTEAVIPCLSPSPVDLERYCHVALERFRNVALGDTNRRVAADGYAKLTGFIAPTVRERLSRREPIDAVAMLPALYLAYLELWARGGVPWPYEDQAFGTERARTLVALPDPVAALCTEVPLWGEFAGAPALVTAVRRARAAVEALSR